MGIDISIASTGWAAMSVGGRLLASGTIRTRRGEHAARRAAILSEIAAAVEAHEVGAVAVEKVRLFSQGKISMGAIAGLVALSTTIEDWCFRRGVVVRKVPVQSWRKVVLGDGRARKPEVVAWVARRFGRTVGHDEADAIGLACWCLEEERRRRR
jgi:Holliday junction resolvasome RuvABC endonuclease subunit